MLIIKVNASGLHHLTWFKASGLPVLFLKNQLKITIKLLSNK